MAVAVTVNHRTKPGQRNAVQAVWEGFMPGVVASNPGHLAYWYTFDRSDPQVIRAFQVYRDDEAAQAFLTNEAYLGYTEQVAPLLEGAPEVSMAEVIWAKETTHAL